jgi:tetratricopeptide (TPR) repeat protein
MKQFARALLALVVCAAAAPAQDDVLVKLYTEAREAEAAGNYQVATQRYERIVSLRPTMAEAHANLGNLYYVQDLRDKAVASFKKAIRLKPSLAAPHFFLGVLAFNTRDFEHALSYLKEAEQLEPSNTLAPLYIGYTFYVQKRYQEAAEVLDRVIENDPKNLDAWYHLTKLHAQLSKAYFDKLQTGSPNSFHTALARSHFFESGANWEQASQELSKAVEIDKDKPELKKRLEWLKQRMGGQTEAAPPADILSGSTRYLYTPPVGDKILEAYSAERKRSQEVLRRKTETEESLYALADAHQALSFLSSLWVLQTDPDSYRAHELRGEALEAAGKTDEAIDEYRQALKIKPELQTVHFSIGNIYWRGGRMDEALVELGEELKVNPADPNSHYELGDILLSQNKLDDAEKHFLQALKFSPDLTEGHLAMERIASAKGDSATAILHLKKAVALAPENSAPHYRLWLLYRKMGRTAEAQKERELFEKLKALERK